MVIKSLVFTLQFTSQHLQVWPSDTPAKVGALRVSFEAELELLEEVFVNFIGRYFVGEYNVVVESGVALKTY